MNNNSVILYGILIIWLIGMVICYFFADFNVSISQYNFDCIELSIQQPSQVIVNISDYKLKGVVIGHGNDCETYFVEYYSDCRGKQIEKFNAKYVKVTN